MNSTTSLGSSEIGQQVVSTRPKLSIVIVTWNVCDYLRACLQSIADDGVHHWAHVMVVDNASTDLTVDMVSQEFPWVELVASKNNLGFSRGNNLGMRKACSDYILLLNPDTVVHRGSIERLLAFAEIHPEAAVFGPKQVDGEGHTSYEGAVNFPSNWNVFCEWFLLARLLPTSRIFNSRVIGSWNHEGEREVDGIAGSAMLLRASALQNVGFLDESMHYAEDMDLCMRLQRGGWKTYYVGSSSITHYGGASSSRAKNAPQRLQIAFHSFWWFLYKHRGKATAARLSCMMFVWAVLLVAMSFPLTLVPFNPQLRCRARELRAIAMGMVRWSLTSKFAFEHPLANRLPTQGVNP